MESTSKKLYLGFLNKDADEKHLAWVLSFVEFIEKLFEGGVERWVEEKLNFFGLKL